MGHRSLGLCCSINTAELRSPCSPNQNAAGVTTSGPCWCKVKVVVSNGSIRTLESLWIEDMNHESHVDGSLMTRITQYCCVIGGKLLLITSYFNFIIGFYVNDHQKCCEDGIISHVTRNGCAADAVNGWCGRSLKLGVNQSRSASVIVHSPSPASMSSYKKTFPATTMKI